MRTPTGTDPTHVPGVLALELAPDSVLARDALGQDETGRLATLLGRDLGALVDGVRELDLVFATAHFDPAEVLRPGWPLHKRLDELRQRAPQAGQGARILAFGADRNGVVPQPFRADADLRGGQLRVLPFLFVGEAAAAAPVAARMEALLLDQGMAKADTALCAQEAFGARLEHVRYFTVLDLAAMTAMQYANQGLEPLWRLLETALLSPASEALLDVREEPMVRYADGQARIARMPFDAWRRRYLPRIRNQARIDRGLAAFEARKRQFAAVFAAHGIATVEVDCSDARGL